MKLQSQRLILRNLKQTDVEPFFNYRSDPEIFRYQTFSLFSKEDAMRFLEKQQYSVIKTPGEWVQIAIEKIDENILIGDCAVKLNSDEPRVAEIGYSIARPYQGQGFATEALRENLFPYLFKEKGIHKINALVDYRNIASIKLLQSLGFIKEAHFRKSYFEEGGWHDEFQYGLLEEEFVY